MRESKQSQAEISTHGIKSKEPSMRKNHTFCGWLAKVLIFSAKKPERARRRRWRVQEQVRVMKQWLKREISKGFNVNLRSANDVKSHPHDRATCRLITMWVDKRHFRALCTSCHRMPRRTVGRGHSLFVEQVASSRLGGLCTDRSSGVDQSQHGGTQSKESSEGVSLRSTSSGVDRPRTLTDLGCHLSLAPGMRLCQKGVPSWYPRVGMTVLEAA